MDLIAAIGKRKLRMKWENLHCDLVALHGHLLHTWSHLQTARSVAVKKPELINHKVPAPEDPATYRANLIMVLQHQVWVMREALEDLNEYLNETMKRLDDAITLCREKRHDDGAMDES